LGEEEVRNTRNQKKQKGFKEEEVERRRS